MIMAQFEDSLRQRSMVQISTLSSMKRKIRWFKDPLPQYCTPNHLIPMTMTTSSRRLAAQANQKHFYSQRSFRNSHLKLVTSKVLAHNKWQRTSTRVSKPNTYVVTKVREKKTMERHISVEIFKRVFKSLKMKIYCLTRASPPWVCSNVAQKACRSWSHKIRIKWRDPCPCIYCPTQQTLPVSW